MPRLVLRIWLTVTSPALSLLLLLSSAQAQPAPPDKAKLKVARSYVSAGMAAHETGDYDTAITFYRKAYEVVPHPLLLFNIAQAHRQAGRGDEAVELYREFLAAHATGPEAQIARDLLAELEREGKGARRREAVPDEAGTPGGDAVRGPGVVVPDEQRASAVRAPTPRVPGSRTVQQLESMAIRSMTLPANRELYTCSNVTA